MISLDTIREVHGRLAPHVVRTPSVPYYGSALAHPRLTLKMELFQRTGSFKARGALNVVSALSDAERERGVVAVSAGNHAIAAAWAARAAGVSCKVVMPRAANPFRVAQVEAQGGEIVYGDAMGELFSLYEKLRESEGRAAVHPFEGERTFAGTAGVALELLEDAGPLDAIVVPVGGGGLISGIASAVRHLSPVTRVYGVEPEGANGMARSLEAGHPLPKVKVSSIADSLCAPLHLPLSFAVVRDRVERMVSVPDAAIAAAMRLAFTDLKLALEPACAAGLAALTSPLREELADARVAVVLCGTNIDAATWARLAETGAARD